MRTLDHAIETLGKRPVRKLDPPVLRGAAPRRVPARLSRWGPGLRRSERVGRARAPRKALSGPFRSRTRSYGASPRESRRCWRNCRRGRSSTRTRTGCGTYGAAIRGRRRARSDAGPERAATSRCQTRPGQSPDGSETDIPNAYVSRPHRRTGFRRGSDLAAEPGLAAGRGSASARRRESECSISARRPAARRRCSRGDVVASR